MGFLVWLLRGALYSRLLCQAVAGTAAFEGVCTRAAIHPAKTGGALGFRNCGLCGKRWSSSQLPRRSVTLLILLHAASLNTRELCGRRERTAGVCVPVARYVTRLRYQIKARLLP